MKHVKMNVVHFDNNDVIVTSGESLKTFTLSHFGDGNTNNNIVTPSEGNSDNFIDSKFILLNGVSIDGNKIINDANNYNDKDNNLDQLITLGYLLAQCNGTYEWNQTESAYKFKQ